MIAWVGLAVLAGALLILAAERHHRAFVARAEAQTPVTGRMIEAGGAHVHVREAGRGDGASVLLIHGALANLRELAGPLADLEQNFHVIAYDRPGLGHSSRPRNAARLGAQARVARDVLAACAAGPAIIVGHSLGAAVALRLALDFPGLVRGLVLVAPASHPYPGKNAWWARLAATPFLGAAFCRWVVPAFGPSLGKRGVRSNFAPAPVPHGYWREAGVDLAFRPEAFRASARDVVATRGEFAAQAPRYSDILAPAIVVASERDLVASTRIHARPLAYDLAGELVSAPGAGHMPHRLRADLVVAAVARVHAIASAEAGG